MLALPSAKHHVIRATQKLLAFAKIHVAYKVHAFLKTLLLKTLLCLK